MLSDNVQSFISRKKHQLSCCSLFIYFFNHTLVLSVHCQSPITWGTRPAWAGFKTAEEGWAKICKFLWQKLKNKSNIEKYIMNNFSTLLEQF
jgi:hypothetical protein